MPHALLVSVVMRMGRRVLFVQGVTRLSCHMTCSHVTAELGNQSPKSATSLQPQSVTAPASASTTTMVRVVQQDTTQRGRAGNGCDRIQQDARIGRDGGISVMAEWARQDTTGREEWARR